jgi:hypothetical protein
VSSSFKMGIRKPQLNLLNRFCLSIESVRYVYYIFLHSSGAIICLGCFAATSSPWKFIQLCPSC